MAPQTQKIMRIVAIVLMVLTAIGALPAGFSFIVDPSGAGLGATPDVLRFSPFTDFFVPGLILFFVNGILNLTVAVLCMARFKQAPYAVMFQGAMLLGWIVIQIGMLQVFNWYHVVFGSIGIVLMLLGWRMQKGKRLVAIP